MAGTERETQVRSEFLRFETRHLRNSRTGPLPEDFHDREQLKTDLDTPETTFLTAQVTKRNASGGPGAKFAVQ